jgi:gamma-aminobutyric acid type B receptor
VLAVIVILLALVVIVLLGVFRNNSVIRCASPVYCTAMCVGAMVMVFSVFFLSRTASTAYCILFPWFVCIGFTLFYGSLLAKSVRVYFLFRSVNHFRAVQVPCRQFLPIVCVFLLVDILLLTLLTAIDTPYVCTVCVHSCVCVYVCMCV